LRLHRQRIDVGKVPSGAPYPGARSQVSSLPSASVVTRGLDVPKSEPGGRTEIAGGDLVVHEAVQDAVGGVGSAEGLSERGCEFAVDGDVGGHGGEVPVIACSVSHQ